MTPAFVARVVGLPAVAGDARSCERHADDPGARAAARRRRPAAPALMRSCDCRFTAMHRVPRLGVHVDQQLVAGDAGVVDDDVEPAGAARAGASISRCGASAAVMSSCSAVPPIAVGDLGQRLAGRREVDGDHVRAVAGQHLGDRGADAARRAGDHGDLAGQRLVPVLRRRAASAAPSSVPAARRRRPTGRTGRSAAADASDASSPAGTRAGSPSSRRAAPCRGSGRARRAPAGPRPAPGSRRRPAARPSTTHPAAGPQPLDRRARGSRARRPGRPGRSARCASRTTAAGRSPSWRRRRSPATARRPRRP